MSTTTAHYNLIKADGSDPFRRQDFLDNFDSIDAGMYQALTAAQAAQSTADTALAGGGGGGGGGTDLAPTWSNILQPSKLLAKDASFSWTTLTITPTVNCRVIFLNFVVPGYYTNSPNYVYMDQLLDGSVVNPFGYRPVEVSIVTARSPWYAWTYKDITAHTTHTAGVKITNGQGGGVSGTSSITVFTVGTLAFAASAGA